MAPDRPGLTDTLAFITAEARFFIQRSPDIMVRLDLDGRIGWVNPAITYWLGFEVSEVIGRPFVEYIYRDDIPKFREAYQTLTTASITGRAQFRLIKKSGGLRYFGLRGSDFNSQGRAYLTLRDVSMQRAYEEELNQLNHHLAQLILESKTSRAANVEHLLINGGHSPLIGVTLVDESGIILRQNAYIARFGYQPQEMIGRNAFTYIWPDDIDQARRAFAGLLDRPYEIPHVALRWKRADGRAALIGVVGVNLLENEKIRAIVIMFWDLSPTMDAHHGE